MTVGERGGARFGEPDIRIAAQTEVAALAVDGQPLHPVATPAAGLDDEKERAAVAVPSRSQRSDLLGSESSAHPDLPVPRIPRISHARARNQGHGDGSPRKTDSVFFNNTGIIRRSTEWLGVLRTLVSFWH